MGTERPKILIVSGYHPEETFAVRVGEYLLENNSNPDIRVVRYPGKPDNPDELGQLIENYNPTIAPIVLHGDDEQDYSAAIVYLAKTEEEMELIEEPLLNFVSRYDVGLIYSGQILNDEKYTQVDIELNSKQLSLQKAADLVKSFAEYLLDLYPNEGG